MCYQGHLYCSCGHTLIVEGFCELSPDIPFPIKAACPNYGTKSHAVAHPCGRGTFYCSETPEGTFFNNIWALVDQIDSRIKYVDADILGIYESKAGYSNALAMRYRLPLIQAGPEPRLILPLQLERDNAAAARVQAMEVISEGMTFVRQRVDRFHNPSGVWPLTDFEVSQRLKATLGEEVGAIVDKFEKARKDPNDGLLVDAIQAEEPARMQAQDQPRNAEAPPDRRYDIPHFQSNQGPLENLVNPGMEALQAGINPPPTALTKGEIRKRQQEYLESRLSKFRRGKWPIPETPSRRTSRAVKKVDYTEPDTDSEEFEWSTGDSDLLYVSTDEASSEQGEMEGDVSGQSKMDVDSPEKSEMLVDSPQSTATTKSKEASRTGRKTPPSFTAEEERVRTGRKALPTIKKEEDQTGTSFYQPKPLSNKRVQLLRGDIKQAPPPKFPSLTGRLPSCEDMLRAYNSGPMFGFTGQPGNEIYMRPPMMSRGQMPPVASNPYASTHFPNGLGVTRDAASRYGRKVSDFADFPTYQPIQVPPVQQFGNYGTTYKPPPVAPNPYTSLYGPQPGNSWTALPGSSFRPPQQASSQIPPTQQVPTRPGALQPQPLPFVPSQKQSVPSWTPPTGGRLPPVGNFALPTQSPRHRAQTPRSSKEVDRRAASEDEEDEGGSSDDVEAEKVVSAKKVEEWFSQS